MGRFGVRSSGNSGSDGRGYGGGGDGRSHGGGAWPGGGQNRSGGGGGNKNHKKGKQLCSYFLSEKGCNRGDKCRRSHGGGGSSSHGRDGGGSGRAGKGSDALCLPFLYNKAGLCPIGGAE